MQNPLLRVEPPIPFAHVGAEHVRPAVEQLVAEARQAIEAIANGSEPRTFESTLGALENATEHLERCMAVVSHLESVATTTALRDAYNSVQPTVSEFWSTVPLHAGLYAAVRAFADTAEAQTMSAPRKRLLEKTLDEFRRQGAELDDVGKKRLSAVDVALAEATNKFSQNVLDATNAFELLITDEERLAGLPESAKQAARASAEAKGKAGYRFTLQAPSVVPVLTYLDDATVREQLWRAFNNRAAEGDHDNRELLRTILRLRRERARLLGYRDFADLTLADRMAGKADTARHFVADLADRTRAFFEREQVELQQFRRDLEGPAARELAPWDTAYYSEKLRKARFNFDGEQVRPYFPAEQAIKGLFEVAHRLYGVTIEQAHDLPVWDEAVRAFRIREADGRHSGTFYVDLYPRENKRGGAWMKPLITSLPPDPHLGLFCANVTPPVGDTPALLSHDQVETLFHEFGHLMHHCSGSVPVRSLSGIRVAWDFVELPSQIMENWCWERAAVDTFAKHHATGEKIPSELFESMLRARAFRAATMQTRQLGFASVDLALHVDYDPDRDGDVVSYCLPLFRRFSPVPLPDDYAMIASFTHLFGDPVGYGAGYYSYKWAEVLDADAFGRFRERGIFDSRTGHEFRERILAAGDSRPAMELFVSFMGREPKLDALLERQGLR